MHTNTFKSSKLLILFFKNIYVFRIKYAKRIDSLIHENWSIIVTSLIKHLDFMSPKALQLFYRLYNFHDFLLLKHNRFYFNCCVFNCFLYKLLFFCISKSFNTNISHQLFDYIINFVNSQHEKTNSKVDFVLVFKNCWYTKLNLTNTYLVAEFNK